MENEKKRHALSENKAEDIALYTSHLEVPRNVKCDSSNQW